MRRVLCFCTWQAINVIMDIHHLFLIEYKMEKQLLDYVEQESKRGVAAQMIKKALRDAGWDDALVEEAFVSVQSPEPPARPQAEENADVIANNEETAATAGKKSSHRLLLVISISLMIFMIFVGGIFWFLNSGASVGQQNPVNSSILPVPQDKTPSSSVDAVSKTPATGNATGTQGAAGNTNSSSSAEILGNGTGVVPAQVATSSVAAATSTDVQAAQISARDNQRMEDMRKLAMAQQSQFMFGGKYYTCGLAAGDCGGKPFGYPAQIGSFLVTSQDPSYGQKFRPVCGNDYIYCGLNNAPYPQFFCYYAKLEAGGYYTASHAGNFKRSTAPKIFEDCALAN